MPKGVLFEHGPIAHGERPGNLAALLRVPGRARARRHDPELAHLDLALPRLRERHDRGRAHQLRRLGQARAERRRHRPRRVRRRRRFLGCDIDTGDDCIALFGSQRVHGDRTARCRRARWRSGSATTLGARSATACSRGLRRSRDANRGLGVFVRGAGGVENVLFKRRHDAHSPADRPLVGQGRADPRLGHPLGARRDPSPAASATSASRASASRASRGSCCGARRRARSRRVSLDDMRLRPWSAGRSRTPTAATSTCGSRATRSTPCSSGTCRRCSRGTCAASRCGTCGWSGPRTRPRFFSHAIECEDFEDVEIRGFRGGRAPGRSGAAIRLRRGTDAIVTDSRASAGTDTFIELTGVSGREVRLDERHALGAARGADGGPARAESPGREAAAP